MNGFYNDALRTCEVILAFAERKKISYASFKGVISNYFWEGEAAKMPEKIKSVGFVSGARPCHEHKMSTPTNNFFAKEEWFEKARNVLYNV
jgi:hypothetical protein